MATTKWGFDVRDLDASVRPQDDFYHYVNKKWMDANPIPKNESQWGAFVILMRQTDKKLKSIVDELLKKRNLPAKSAGRLVGDFFKSGMDMKRRDAAGIAPIAHLLSEIARAKDVDALVRTIAKLERIGVAAPWIAAVHQDSKNSERYMLHLAQDGLGLPDRDYYLKDDPESVRVRTAYLSHVENLFKLMGSTPAEAKRNRDTHLRVETAIAKVSMRKEDVQDAHKTYHLMSRAQLRKLAPRIDWDTYLQVIKADVRQIIVMQPDFLAGVSMLFDNIPLDDWKTYLSWHVANDFSGTLSSAFARQRFSFYGKVLSGQLAMKPLWRRVLGVVDASLGELIGQIYVERYFPKEAKQKMDAIVDDLFTAFETRIDSLEWMSAPTKRKALRKLHALNRKIGYPDKWKSYAGLEIASSEYVGNIIRTNEYEHRRAMKKLTGPIDRGEWFMHPQTVNAYFEPTMNDIAFPAAILQPPFFDMYADDAVNYGAIGAVIGHEMTHGFDDNGAKYDHNGNLKDWWGAEDKKRFDAKAKRVERQYDRYEVADGVKVNGKLTLGENIADMGGLSIAYDAYQMQLARTGREDIDGLTPEQRFFLSFAVFERENIRPEALKTKVLTNEHAPGIFRINGPLANYSAFYAAFGVKKGDALYRDPKDREMVW